MSNNDPKTVQAAATQPAASKPETAKVSISEDDVAYGTEKKRSS